MESNNWHLEETYKSMIQISTVVMRFILVANGGAAVALLAFAGNLYAKEVIPPNFAPAMYCFLGGVMAGGLTCIFSYLTQLTLYRESRDKLGTNKHHTPLHIAMVFALCGVILFGLGSWLGINQFPVSNKQVQLTGLSSGQKAASIQNGN